MWVAQFIVLTVLAAGLFVVPWLFLALVLDDRPVLRRRATGVPRVHCVHELASAATGIACPCVTGGGTAEVAELPSPGEPGRVEPIPRAA